MCVSVGSQYISTVVRKLCCVFVGSKSFQFICKDFELCVGITCVSVCLHKLWNVYLLGHNMFLLVSIDVHKLWKLYLFGQNMFQLMCSPLNCVFVGSKYVSICVNKLWIVHLLGHNIFHWCAHTLKCVFVWVKMFQLMCTNFEYFGVQQNMFLLMFTIFEVCICWVKSNFQLMCTNFEEYCWTRNNYNWHALKVYTHKISSYAYD